MLLPLKKDKHFVEFYEGFLLGMYQLKKAGDLDAAHHAGCARR